MKFFFIRFLLFFCVFSLFSCKKYNPEDPWFSHGGKHLNDRLEGEWELMSLHMNNQDYYTWSEDDIYTDFSTLLDIDTIKIAKFFKFVPAHKQSKVEGTGDVLIKTKSMTSYPEKIGISQSTSHNLNDTNVALAKLTYQFKEGKSKNFFRFDFSDIVAVDSLTSDIHCFKPFDEHFVFNNFFIKFFEDFTIKKATKKELILYIGFISYTGTPKVGAYKRYRLTFKKIN